MKVTFCGHREIQDKETIELKLITTLEKLMEEQIDDFFIGGYGSFDTLAAKAVRSLKTSYPMIRLILVVPYINKGRYIDIYDEIVYPPLEEVPPKYAIIKRNEWMIDQSDIVISYVTHLRGGAAKTLDYAVRKKKRIISLADT